MRSASATAVTRIRSASASAVACAARLPPCCRSPSPALRPPHSESSLPCAPALPACSADLFSFSGSVYCIASDSPSPAARALGLAFGLLDLLYLGRFGFEFGDPHLFAFQLRLHAHAIVSCSFKRSASSLAHTPAAIECLAASPLSPQCHPPPVLL